MKQITGYSDKLSVMPGQSIKFMVSSENNEDYEVKIHRIIHGDANPEGSGFKSVVIDAGCNGRKKGLFQRIKSGSYITIPESKPFINISEMSLGAMIYPTQVGETEQTIVDRTSPDLSRGFRIYINRDGAIGFSSFGRNGKEVKISTEKSVRKKKWYFIGVIIDKDSNIKIFQKPLLEEYMVDDESRRNMNSGNKTILWDYDKDTELFIATDRESINSVKNQDKKFYNGKIDRLRIAGKALKENDLERLVHDPCPDEKQFELLAAWDFSKDIMSNRVTDLSSNNMHGYSVNLPARGVTGYNWNGSEMCWKYSLSQYGAIHFHDDDLYDAGWDVGFSWDIPIKTSSGIYAAEIKNKTDSDYIVFFIRPVTGKPTAKIALLIPTASYMAYGNEHMAFNAPLVQLVSGRLTILNENDLALNQHRELGLSCYDTHSDGSGVFYSSRLRPLLNMRPMHTGCLGGHGSSVWQFNADTHITDWLENQNYSYDVITDEDLHREGLPLLKDYKVILTGTHPEYYSTKMWDSLYSYTHRGGRLMYLGGNGFYWRIAYSDVYPGAIELRRAEDGTRTWASEPGEYYHNFSGEYGGLWRRLGRPPQKLAGVGFIAQGFDISSSYKREKESYDDERAAFIFEGVEDENIGDFGLVGGGAAGLELDHTDPQLGTPPNTIVLATSFRHSDLYQIVTEEVLTSNPSTSAMENKFVRAQLVYFDTRENGAVFSTGSIAWCGSLSHNNYNNNVSRITKNVLDKFVS